MSTYHQSSSNLRAAQQPILSLARLLQRAAFVDHPEESVHSRAMANPDSFDPAPLYMRQAVALLGHTSLCREMYQSRGLLLQRRH